MRYPTLHAFLKWVPTAIGGGAIAVAAVWTEAKNWIAEQVIWGWAQMSNPWIAALTLFAICAYIWAIIWTGQARKNPPEVAPGSKTFDIARPSNVPRVAPPLHQFEDFIIWLGETIRNWVREIIRKLFHRGLPDETKPIATLGTEARPKPSFANDRTGDDGPKVAGDEPARVAARVAEMWEPPFIEKLHSGVHSPAARPTPRRCPETPIWKAVDYVRQVIGDEDEGHCYPETMRQIRQAARDHRIEIWGRREIPPTSLKSPQACDDVWEPIEPGYWREFEINSMATGEAWDGHDHTWSLSSPSNGRGNRYWTLRADQAEIEREWPRPTKHGYVDRTESPKADIRLEAFLGRIYKKLGWRPSGASQFQLEAFHRKVNLEILDAMSLHKLHVWGRVGDLATRPISPVEREFATIDHLKGELRSLGSEEDAIVWTDLRFVKAEVDKVWPPPSQKDK